MTNHPKISSKDFEKELKGGKYEGEYDTCQKKKKTLWVCVNSCLPSCKSCTVKKINSWENLKRK